MWIRTNPVARDHRFAVRVSQDSLRRGGSANSRLRRERKIVTRDESSDAFDAFGSNLKRWRRFGVRGSASYSYPTHSKQMNHAPKWPTEFRRHVASTYVPARTLAHTTTACIRPPAGAAQAAATKKNSRIKCRPLYILSESLWIEPLLLPSPIPVADCPSSSTLSIDRAINAALDSASFDSAFQIFYRPGTREFSNVFNIQTSSRSMTLPQRVVLSLCRSQRP